MHSVILPPPDAPLSEVDRVLAEALRDAESDLLTAPVGIAHERSVLKSLAWFRAMLDLPTLSAEDAQSLSLRLHRIERIAASLSDQAGRRAENR